MTVDGARRRRPVVAVLTVALLVLAAGCGSTIPTDEDATVLAREDLNPGLSESTTTTLRSGQTVTRNIYLIRDSDRVRSRMFSCPLEVELQESAEATARATLETLIRTEPGRSPQPRTGCSDLLTNFVPTELQINSIRLDVAERRFTLDLSGLAAVEATAQRQAVAQIVFTLTDRIFEVDQVVFLNDGRPSAVPVGAGTTEPGEPVSRADFPDYDEGRSASTTTAAPPDPVEADPPLAEPGASSEEPAP